MVTLKAVPVDSAALRLRAYHVDCSPLLKRWELMVRASQRNRASGVIACSARPIIGGTTLEVQVAGWQSTGGKAPKRPHIAVITTHGLLDLWLTGFADAAAGAALDLEVDTRDGMPIQPAAPARQFPLR